MKIELIFLNINPVITSTSIQCHYIHHIESNPSMTWHDFRRYTSHATLNLSKMPNSVMYKKLLDIIENRPVEIIKHDYYQIPESPRSILSEPEEEIKQPT